MAKDRYRLKELWTILSFNSIKGIFCIIGMYIKEFVTENYINHINIPFAYFYNKND